MSVDNMHASTGREPWVEIERAVQRQSMTKSLGVRLASLGAGQERFVVSKAVSSGVASQASKMRVTRRHKLVQYGVTGSQNLVGREESPRYSDEEVSIDFLRMAYTPGGNRFELRHKQFDKEAVTVGAELLSTRMMEAFDEIFMGVSASRTLDVALTGELRNDEYKDTELPDDLKFLECPWDKMSFNADIVPPSSNRFGCLKRDKDGNAWVDYSAGNDTLTAADIISADHFVMMREALADSDIPPVTMHSLTSPIPIDGAKYVAIVSDATFTDLKLDPNFRLMQRECLPRSNRHPLFAGSEMIEIDGFLIIPDRLAPTVRRAKEGYRYGKDRDLYGNQILVFGMDAMTMVIGAPEFDKGTHDYNFRQGLGMYQAMGFKKNQIVTDLGARAVDRFTRQDAGIMSFFVANRNQKPRGKV